jgi:hypothetical protein
MSISLKTLFYTSFRRELIGRLGILESDWKRVTTVRGKPSPALYTFFIHSRE